MQILSLQNFTKQKIMLRYIALRGRILFIANKLLSGQNH